MRTKAKISALARQVSSTTRIRIVLTERERGLEVVLKDWEEPSEKDTDDVTGSLLPRPLGPLSASSSGQKLNTTRHTESHGEKIESQAISGRWT